jgi:adenine-specific DNA-methyltransferase
MASTSQLTLLPPDQIVSGSPDNRSNHGEVFTRRWVVEFILNLVGYRPGEDLASKVIVEPACGTGAFLIPVVERLLESCRGRGHDIAGLTRAVRAYDLLESNVELTRKAVVQLLVAQGCSVDLSERLAEAWVTTADFLLTDHESGSADFVVGNPPYIRLEDVPRYLTDAYRRACPTMRGRSDIYVGFLEVGMRILVPDGRLGFICADRWMHNDYGSALRDLITSEYAIESIVSMHDVDAFEDEVSAYPAVVVIRNGTQEDVRVVNATAGFEVDESRAVTRWIEAPDPTLSLENAEGTRIDKWFTGTALWPSGNNARKQLVADLEHRFSPLEDPDTGTRVGIGLATGCDDVYVTADAELVEQERLLPLVLARDTAAGAVDWSGQYLVNPWGDHGLVDLLSYPRLKVYLEKHEDRLRARHVAKRRPESWYRTIDRVDPTLTMRPKLLLPDIKARSNPVLDAGDLYPHHNLYFVVSERWDLEVLGGLLLSDVANAVIGAYCVKMRGGTYRFQAQYIRKMRVPDLSAIDKTAQRKLAEAFRARDVEAATDLACSIFEVDPLLVMAALRT